MVPQSPSERIGLRGANLVVAAVFVLFGGVLLPLAVGLQAHLYGDGAFYLTRLVEQGTVTTAGQPPSRGMMYLLTQGPMLAAFKLGVKDLRLLSWLFGAGLYYVPWLGYALAAWIFSRAGHTLAALLTAALYALSHCSTAFFIITESHVGAGAFVLTLALICTRRPGRVLWGPLAALGVISLALYESWTFFYPACAALLMLRHGRALWRRGTRARVALAALLMLYLAGALFNGNGIFSSSTSVNRDYMLEHQLAEQTGRLAGFTAGFALALVWAGGAAWVVAARRKGRRIPSGLVWLGTELSGPGPWVLTAALVAWGGKAALDLTLAPPRDAYALRVLNLGLPLMLAAYLSVAQVARLPRRGSRGLQRALTLALAGLLCVSTAAAGRNVLGFARYQDQLFEICQASGGYVQHIKVLRAPRPYWHEWTCPALCMLIQQSRGAQVRGLVYNPWAPWQPYGPGEQARVQAFCQKLNPGQ